MTVEPPVLVTGMHRSGTTWVGDMLTLSPQAHYVHEPFAPMNHRSWLSDPPTTRYLHLPLDKGGAYERDIQRIANLSPRWSRIARRVRGPRDGARLVQDVVRTQAARRRGARAVIKDPFALLSAEWLADRTDADVVVLVRHPAAFASSTLRLGWRLDERWLLGQPDFLAAHLKPFQADLEAANGLDLLAHACLLWRTLTAYVGHLREEHPDWTVLRYEDLALQPAAGFRDLYDRVDFRWDDRIAEAVAWANDPAQGIAVAPGDKGGTRRDSRSAMWTWRHRLTAEQVDLVRSSTADVATGWYGDDQWWVPDQEGEV